MNMFEWLMMFTGAYDPFRPPRNFTGNEPSKMVRSIVSDTLTSESGTIKRKDLIELYIIYAHCFRQSPLVSFNQFKRILAHIMYSQNDFNSSESLIVLRDFIRSDVRGILNEIPDYLTYLINDELKNKGKRNRELYLNHFVTPLPERKFQQMLVAETLSKFKWMALQYAYADSGRVHKLRQIAEAQYAENVINHQDPEYSIYKYNPTEILAFATIIFSKRDHQIRKLVRSILSDLDYFDSFFERTGKQLALFLPVNAQPKAFDKFYQYFELDVTDGPYFMLFHLRKQPSRIEYLTIPLKGPQQPDYERELNAIFGICERVLSKIKPGNFDNAQEIFNLLVNAFKDEKTRDIIRKVAKFGLPKLISIFTKR